MRHKAKYEPQPDGSTLKFRRINGGWQRWLLHRPGVGWSRFPRCYVPLQCQQYERP